MSHPTQFSAAKMACALVLATLAGFGLSACGGGGGSSSVTPPVDNGVTPPVDNGNVSSCSASPSPAGLQVIPLQAGSQQICAELANTPEQREQGLMFRNELAPDAGMLFDYLQPTSICMWMQNTLIPLSVAFIDQNGVIMNITDMEPKTIDPHCSITPARYSLEMNQGWFAQKNIVPGSTLSGLP